MPGSRSVDFPISRGRKSVDLAAIGAAGKETTLELFEAYWDFGGGSFNKVDGSMRIMIRLRSNYAENGVSLFTPENLIALARKRMNHSTFHISANLVSQEDIGGCRWIFYKISGDSGKRSMRDFLLAIGNNHYLHFGIDLIPNSENYLWMNRATEMYKRVLESVVVYHKHSGQNVRSCLN
ncbi:hypothetical protein GCM10025776_03790 [Corallincola platygyrae]